MTGLEKFIGEVLDGKYRLERLLGQGGMGAVYLATHLGTERPVALKLIAPQFMRNDEFVERFKREARAAGRLRHPNVVDVTDFGFAQADGERVAYLVMEYLDGCTLGDVLAEEKRLPLDWTADILEQVCSAVEEAHNQGIVHRDLKPDNIWLEPNRLGGYRVKVLDFGIAKLAEAGAQSTNAAQAGATTDAARSAANNAPSGASNDATLLLPSPLQSQSPSPSQSPSQSQSQLHHDAGAEGATRLFAPVSDPEAVPRTNDEVGEQQTRIFASQPKDGFASQRNDEDDHAPPSHDAQSAHAAAAARAPRATHLADEADGTRLFDAQTPRPTAHAHAPTEDERAPMRTAAADAALTRVGSIMGTPTYMSPEQCRGERLDARSDIYSLGVITYQMLAGETPFTGNMVSVMRAHMNDDPRPLRERNKKVPKKVARLVMTALAKNPPVRPQSAAAFSSALRASTEGADTLLRRGFALYSEHFPVFLRVALLAYLPVIVTIALMLLLEVTDAFTVMPKVLALAVGILIVLLLVTTQLFASFTIVGVTVPIVLQLMIAPLRPVSIRTAFAILRRRARPFALTSLGVSLRIIVGFCLFIIPGFIVLVRYALVAPVVLMEDLRGREARQRSRELVRRSRRTVILIALLNIALPLVIQAILSKFFGTSMKFRTRSGTTIQLSQNFSQLLNIFISPILSITSALLYLQTRRAGGETLGDVTEQFEREEAPRAQWQRRMRERLSGYTPQSRSRIGQPSDPSKLG